MSTPSSLPRRLRFVFATLALTALLLATLAPVLARRGRVESAGVYIALSPLCHQRADRSWSFGGLPAGLCIRCYGVYGGISVAALLGLPFSRHYGAAGLVAIAALWILENLVGSPASEAARFAGGGGLGLLAASFTNRNGRAGPSVERLSSPNYCHNGAGESPEN